MAALISCDEDAKEGVIAVTGVSLNKTSLSLVAGKSETLTATVLPAEATNRDVIWLSSAPGVATVNGSGLVTAVSPGTAEITVTTLGGGKTASCVVTVTSPTVKTVSVGTQSGAMTAGAAGTVTFPVTTTNIANGAYTVTVANRPAGVTVQGQVTITAGSGTLTLAGNTSTTAGTTANLTLTLDGATSAAFTLTVSAAATKSVSVGSQSGTLTQGAAGSVTYSVTTANIANSLSATVQWFSNAAGTASASAPTGVTASVSTGAATRTTTVNTTAASPAGTYYFRITIDGVQSNVGTLAIGAATTYSISTSPNPAFGSLTVGYTQPAAQTVTVTNTGSGAVTLNALPSVANYTLTALSTTNLAAGGTATFTIRPNAGLAAGTYNRTFTVAGSNGVNASVTVSFEVTASLTYSISASPNPSFGSLTVGYTQPAAQTVTVTNTGSGAVTLNALPAVSNYTLTALSTTNLTAGGTATFTIRPNAGLAAGTYNPTFNVTGR